MSQLAMNFTAPYFNTTNLTNPALSERKQRAAAQDDTILALYRKHRELSPWQAYEWLRDPVTGDERWAINSVRRSINTLAKRGKLVKTAAYRVGPYMAREHVWTLAVQS